MSKAEDLSMEIAKYIAVGLPIPGELMDNLMKVVCEDHKKEREGSKPSDSQEAVGAV